MSHIQIEQLAERLWNAGLLPAAASAAAAAIAARPEPAGWQHHQLAPGVFVHVYTGPGELPPAVPMTSTGLLP